MPGHPEPQAALGRRHARACVRGQRDAQDCGEIEDEGRRAALTALVGVAGGVLAAAVPLARAATEHAGPAQATGLAQAAGAARSGRGAETVGAATPAGRLKQSVCRWPYRTVELPDFCRRIKQMGFVAIDLLYADEWQIARDAGLTVSMGYPTHRDKFIETGFNNPANHALLLKELETTLPLAARAGVPNVITMFGNRDAAFDDRAAIDNCIKGLSKISRLAEESSVNVCVELLNSRINHPGYQGDRTAFGVAVMKGVNSPRVKLDRKSVV